MKKLFLTLALFFSFILSAQKPADVELWTGGTINYKLSKRLTLDVVEQVRFNNNVTTYKKSFTNVGLKIKLNKRYSVKPSYRFIVLPLTSFEHRVQLDGFYKWSKKKFPLTFAYRMRIQHQFISPKSYFRNKITVGYKLSKLVDPFLAYEIFFRFNGKNEFRVSRITVGLDWRINKRLYLTTYYRLQDDIFVKNPERQHIVGVLLDYDLKKKKKKKVK